MNKPVILIVEDEIILSQWLKMQLEAEGYDVCGRVTTGEEAIALVPQTAPDVVLMDINLAGKMDGIEAAAEIVSQFHIPIIYMTGYDEMTMHQRAKATNPMAYLTKPVEMWDLTPLLEALRK
jgi:CheY-like chemotaxis protein